MSKTLEIKLTDALEHALQVFEDACNCMACGPCKLQSVMRDLINEAREKQNEKQ